MTPSLFFIPGGPGLNSLAEARILGPLLSPQYATTYWNEPSQLRWQEGRDFPGYSFTNWQETLFRDFIEHSRKHGPAVIIAHSFGAHGAVLLAQKFPGLVKGCVFIAPALATLACLQRIVRLSAEDYRQSQTETAEDLLKLAPTLTLPGNPDITQKLYVALTNANLLYYYWVELVHLQKYVELAIMAPGGGFDLAAFFGIYETMSIDHLQKPPLSHQTAVLWGGDDPIIAPAEQQTTVFRCFKNVEVTTWKQARHFPHLENSHEFIPWLEQFLTTRTPSD